MFKLTELFSKPLISIFDGSFEGVIKNVFFDKTLYKLNYLEFFNDDDEIIEDKIINVKDIYNMGDNAISIKNKDCVELKINNEAKCFNNNPINSEVYNANGNYIGKICEVLLNENFEVIELILNNSLQLKSNEILSSGSNLVIIQAENKVKIANFKTKKIKNNKSTDNTQIVEILNSNNSIIQEKLAQRKINQSKVEFKPILFFDKKQNAQLPQKITSQISFLIGRKTNKSIYSSNQVLIAKKNELITDETILNAKKYNKLKDLITFSV